MHTHPHLTAAFSAARAQELRQAADRARHAAGDGPRRRLALPRLHRGARAVAPVPSPRFP